MPVQNKVTHSVKIECDGCTNQLVEVLAVEPNEDVSARWMSVVEDAGWLHVSAYLYSAPQVDDDYPSTTIIACSPRCAHIAFGWFLAENASPQSNVHENAQDGMGEFAEAFGAPRENPFADTIKVVADTPPSLSSVLARGS